MQRLSVFLSRALTFSVTLALCSCGGNSGDDSSGRSAPTYQLSGFLTGLSSGSTITIAVGLDRRVIQTQGDNIIRDVPFPSATIEPIALPAGVFYSVSVVEKPDNATCQVLNGTGVMGAASVTNVEIQCFQTPSLRVLAGRVPKPDVDGIATEIALRAQSLTVARDGTIYVAVDEGLGGDAPLIRRMTRSGFLTTLAGGGAKSDTPVNGAGRDARLTKPRALTMSLDGSTVLFADGTAIRSMTMAGTVGLVAGNLTVPGDGTDNDDADSLEAARFTELRGLVVLSDGTLYVSESLRIRRVETTGRVRTVARAQTPQVRSFPFNGLAIGSDGNVYAGFGPDNDGFEGGVVRLDVATGAVSVRGGGHAAFLLADSASFLAFGTSSQFGLQRVFIDGASASLGKSFIAQFRTMCADGPLSRAQLGGTGGAAFVEEGKVLVADVQCASIRELDLVAQTVSTRYGTLGFGNADGTGSQASFHAVSGLAFDPAAGERGELIVSESYGGTLRSIRPGGNVRRLAGDPTREPSITFPVGAEMRDGVGNDAWFIAPSSVVVGRDGSYYVLDANGINVPNQSLRRVGRDGRVVTLRSDLPRNGSGNEIGLRGYMAIDRSGEADRFVMTTGSVLTGSSIARFSGTGGPVELFASGQLEAPRGLAVSAAGTIYVADGNSIKKIEPTVSGTTATLVSDAADGWVSASALALTEDEKFLIVLDPGLCAIRAIDLALGRVQNVVGTPGVCTLSVGPLPASLGPPFQAQSSQPQSSGWNTHALAVRGNRLYIGFADVVLEADLALR